MRKIVLAITLLSMVSCQADSYNYEPLFICSSKLENPYGICSHINRKGIGYEYDTMNQDIQMIVNTGATWVRTDWDWTSMATKDTCTFDHFDRMMDRLDKMKLNALAIVTLRPGYKMSNQYEWIRFVKKEVRHFRKIENWEVINEIDLVRYWNPGIYATDYVELLKNGYKAVKVGNNNAKVLFSGFANSDSQYLDSILSKNVGDYFDIMNVHRYNHKKSEPEELLSYFQRLHDKLEKYHIRKPVWLTECGCSSASGWNSEKEQAERLPRIFLISYACGIDKVFWYKSRSREIKPTDKEDYFGLWHKDYTPKPSYYAYKTLTTMCPNKSTRPNLIRNGNVFVASWKKPDGKKVWAMWTSKKEINRVIYIKGKYSIYNGKGEKSSYISKEISISPSVTYIVGAKDVRIEN